MPKSSNALLALAREWRVTDYAIQYFLCPWHPKFFGNRKALLRAIRRIAERMPKQYRKEALQAVQEAAAEQDSTGISCDQILLNEKMLVDTLLSLSDEQLETLYQQVDFGDDAENLDFWHETLGYGFPDSEDVEDAEELEKQILVPSLHAHLKKLLTGKSRHHEVSWVAVGIASIALPENFSKQCPAQEDMPPLYGVLAQYLLDRF